MAHATTIVSIAQQLSASVAVIAGSALVTLAASWRTADGASVQGSDFAPALIALAILALVSLPFLSRLEESSDSVKDR